MDHFDKIKNGIQASLSNLSLPKEVSFDNEKVLELRKNKEDFSLFFVNKLLFKVRIKKGQCILTFQGEYQELLPEARVLANTALEVRVNDTGEIVSLGKQIGKIFEYELDKTHGEAFGCCSRYLECSDAAECVREDEDFVFALGCQYRLNLRDNRIFYGEKANC